MPEDKVSREANYIISAPIEFTIKSPEVAGERLDKHLAKQFPGHSRRFLQDLIDNQKILVNGKKKSPSYKTKVGDSISVDLPDRPVKLKIEAQDLNLNVVYEDPNILVINKPAGMVCHPADRYRHLTGTVVNAVLHHCEGQLSGINGVLRPGIVHRLDRDTSGLLIVGKTDIGHRHMSKVIKNRWIEKYYLTLVSGHLKPKKGTIEAPIGRDPKHRFKKAVGGIESKDALTHYEVLEYLGDETAKKSPDSGTFAKATLLKVRIITGRTHQIRVHLSSIGHPVIGDNMYGNDDVNEYFKGKYGLERQFLHAWRLKFRIPGEEKDTEFIGEIPADLQKVLDDSGVEV
ncbi:MAG: RluA family pseudouridine synthase [Candidatus Peregrinibacteria bacterium]|nr:RluA family pseudouridine synthase [Candidatus Peregrinibacteria bacterium]MDZ4245077.1 RluA family pseudouridine synthase [Candidatus Gracilibacteria bacterium]